nr:hypothetical protein [Tanacetum cinerariifolium]
MYKGKQNVKWPSPIGGITAKIDADEDATLEEVDAKKDAEVAKKDADAQERLEESQAQVYHIDLEHADKVLITVAATTITDAPITAAPSAARRRKGVVIRDPEETSTPSVVMHSEPKSKDKGKGILVEEPKPLKKQAQIEQDEAYAKELEAKLNANINWNEVIKHVKRKVKQDNVVLRYQALKRKPQTKAHARKYMMVYLKNMAGFKMDFFKEEEASKAIKRKSKSSEEKAVKKQKLDEEVEELKTHLQLVSNDEDDVYTEATPLALKLINEFCREDLEILWQIVQERFASLKLKNFSDDFLLNTLKIMFEKPNVEDQVWKNQRGNYGLAKVKSWKLLESCGVHIITFTTTQMILLVERKYPLTRFTLDQILNNVRLEVEKESEVSLELLRFVRRKQQEGYKPE